MASKPTFTLFHSSVVDKITWCLRGDSWKVALCEDTQMTGPLSQMVSELLLDHVASLCGFTSMLAKLIIWQPRALQSENVEPARPFLDVCPEPAQQWLCSVPLFELSCRTHSELEGKGPHKEGNSRRHGWALRTSNLITYEHRGKILTIIVTTEPSIIKERYSITNKLDLP